MVIYGALALAGPPQAEMSLSEGRAGTSRHFHCSDPARIVSYTWETTLPTLAERILHFRFTLVGLVIYAIILLKHNVLESARGRLTPPHAFE